MQKVAPTLLGLITDDKQLTLGDRLPKGGYVRAQTLVFNENPDTRVDGDHKAWSRWVRDQNGIRINPCAW